MYRVPAPASQALAVDELLVAVALLPLEVAPLLLAAVLELPPSLAAAGDELLEQPQTAIGANAAPNANKFRVINMRKPPSESRPVKTRAFHRDRTSTRSITLRFRESSGRMRARV
jgi:hypothetical protein